MIHSQYASHYKTHYTAIPLNTVTVRVTMHTTCVRSAFHPNAFVQVNYLGMPQPIHPKTLHVFDQSKPHQDLPRTFQLNSMQIGISGFSFIYNNTLLTKAPLAKHMSMFDEPYGLTH